MGLNMTKAFLIHWNEVEAKERLAQLRKLGFAATYKPFTPEVWKALRASPPDAIVIDLSRLPSHGRDVAMSLRSTKSTRQVPIVFVDGDLEKVRHIKAQLPDAVYTTWRSIKGAIKRAIAKPLTDPVVPESSLAGYSGTPLPKKLGIKAGLTVILVNAPGDFEKTLGKLPENVKLRRQLRGAADLIVWFAKSQAELEKRLPSVLHCLVERGGLWIAWPKKTSGVKSDLTQTTVRNFGLERGLVDHKICAIDATWSHRRCRTRISRYFCMEPFA